MPISSGAQMKCNWQNLRFLNNWCCHLTESKCSANVLLGVAVMRWFTGYKVCMVLRWGVYLWICQIWTFSIIFFMEFDVGHLKEHFFLSRIAFCLVKKQPLFMSNIGLKMAIFNKNAIKYTKWPLLTAYNSWIWPHFLIKRNAILLRKKALSDGLLQIPWKKLLEKFKIDKFKDEPSRENHATLYSVNHLRKYFGTTLWFIQIATSVIEKSQILLVAFHLSTTSACRSSSLNRKKTLSNWTQLQKTGPPVAVAQILNFFSCQLQHLSKNRKTEKKTGFLSRNVLDLTHAHFSLMVGLWIIKNGQELVEI